MGINNLIPKRRQGQINPLGNIEDPIRLKSIRRLQDGSRLQWPKSGKDTEERGFATRVGTLDQYVHFLGYFQV